MSLLLTVGLNPKNLSWRPLASPASCFAGGQCLREVLLIVLQSTYSGKRSYIQSFLTTEYGDNIGTFNPSSTFTLSFTLGFRQ